ncbi:hypothetical protein NA57DRAFT_74089 [Rhizodiscina lignyota]|uniref:RING-type domain-containing protein n=1 Tax=Rhizodiscina lignyota TaxID=1504668 RepID=A0A9P4M799_9PEZI|nr:hypothetical protein NA57DRAFT_74089 [Rhizodiscina lignyota]
MSHSKRNTSLAFFTSYERSLLKSTWGSRSTRLTRDSFLPFGSCQLCLRPAEDPVACPQGDLFCRECALKNLLAQRQDIKRLEKEMEQNKAELEEDERRQDEEAKERAVKEFEMVQMGLEAKHSGGKVVGRENGKVIVEANGNGKEPAQKGTKRKFEIDEEELIRIAKEDRSKMKRVIADEKNAKPHLPSFWVPSETPGTDPAASKALKPQKLHPLCPQSSESAPHQYSLKTLISVKFTEEKDRQTGDPVRSCPACRKVLSNATKAMVAVPCGHVLCKPCVQKFMQPQKTVDAHDPDAELGVLRCYVCEEDLSPNSSKAKEGKKEKDKPRKKDKGDKGGLKPGLVQIKSEGTGFAGGGQNMARKEGVAFQC